MILKSINKDYNKIDNQIIKFSLLIMIYKNGKFY